MSRWPSHTLTATPKDDIDKNTYGIFDLESGVPTYGYELAQAVADKHLVSYLSVEAELKFEKEGIVYDELSAEDQEIYEETFSNEDGQMPASIDSSALNEWLFNADTIRKALNLLMTHGQFVDCGSKIGKTIIFARNHNHAEKIFEIWNKEYPSHGAHYARVIDNYTNYAQSLIDQFSDKDKLPQIAISVDMLDTGIDIPEILNLVFFKKVMSKAKFWQMIGRGTRLCPGLLDGSDKTHFTIFDLCRNFEFFKLNAKGGDASTSASLQEQTFNTRVAIILALQEASFQSESLQSLRQELVKALVAQVKALPRDNFAVRQHLAVVDQYQGESRFNVLTYENTLQIAEHIAPLILPTSDDIAAARFDQLLHQIELAILTGNNCTRARNDLLRKATALTRYANIPAIAAQSDLLEQIVENKLLDRAGISDYEDIRTRLRNLIKFIPPAEQLRYDTDFTDSIQSLTIREASLESDDLINYRKKVSYYILQHQDVPAIAKLKGNEQLTAADLLALEDILWHELGTREQYDAHYGETPLGELVRSIVGLDQQAANQAFSQFMNETPLNSRQMYFVHQVINYIICNGLMKDLSVLQSTPFIDQGSIHELFADTAQFMKLLAVINPINQSALIA